MKNEIVLPNLEKAYTSPNRFTNVYDLWSRYNQIKDSDDSKEKREKIIAEYERKPKIVNGKKHPNFGQLKGRVDDLIQILFDASTEREQIFKISFKNVKDKRLRASKLDLEDKITSYWHECFWKTWEDKWLEEAKDIKEIALFQKAIRFFNDESYKPESIPLSRVFPDSNASIEPKTWNLCFIERKFSIHDLYDIYKADEADSLGWNKDALRYILENPFIFTQFSGASESFNSGNVKVDADYEVTIVDAYVKEYKEVEGKRISIYSFPADPIFCNHYRSRSEYESNKKNSFELKEFLRVSHCEYKCFSDKFAVRAMDINRAYWQGFSFAEQMYTSCVFYNQAMNMVIRSAIRNMVLYLKSDKQETKDKLRNLSTEEVQVLDPGVDLLQTRVKTDIREMTEVVRQIMIDTDNQFNVASSPGSQNVKGYAITAKEAENVNLESTRSRSVTIKVFFGNDVYMYRKIYELSISKNQWKCEEEKDLLGLFNQYLEENDIPKELVDPKNVIITPVYNIQAISPTNRIAKSRGLIEALAFQPVTKGQEQAQREWVAAYVGSSNVQYYLDSKEEIIELQQKVGQENEDLDNPYLNPNNVPIAPSDKHVLEVPIHMADYEYKLTMAQNLIQKASELPQVRKIIVVNAASEIVVAQDNKGAHIEAHIQAALSDPRNEARLKPVIARFNQLRQSQDKLSTDIEKIMQDIDSQNQENMSLTIEQQHKAKMNELEFMQAQRMNDLNLQKAVEKKDGTTAAREDKLTAQQQKQAIDQEAQKQKAAIEISKEELKLQQQKNKENESTTRTTQGSKEK